jgi:MinD superfamily P-loop ATPase
MGVVINRADIGTRDVYDHCQKTGLTILSEIPYQRDIAEAYAKGQIIATAVPSMRALFETLVGRIKTLCGQPSVAREVQHA